MKRFGVDESKGKVDVRPVTQGNILRLHVTTGALKVPALVVADGARVSTPLREVALRMRHRIGATEVDRRATEAMLATAHVEWASGEIRILQTPSARIAFRFTIAIARAFVAAEDGTKATGTGTGIITNLLTSWSITHVHVNDLQRSAASKVT